MKRRIFSVALLSIVLFLLSLHHLQRFVIHPSFDYVVVAESTAGKTWTSFSDSQWDVLQSEIIMEEDFALKNEPESQSRVHYLDAAEVVFDPETRALISEGEVGEVYLQQGRLWGSYYGNKKAPLRIFTDISEITVSEEGSFWMEIDSQYFRFASLAGELRLKVKESDLVTYDAVVPNALVYELERGNARSFRNMTATDFHGRSFSPPAALNEDTKRVKVPSLGSDDSIPVIQAPPVKMVPISDESEIPDMKPAAQPFEETIDEDSVPQADDYTQEELEIIAAQIADSKEPEDAVQEIAFLDGHYKPKIRSGVIIDQDFEGTQPLTAKWYYEPMLEGGPVYIEVKDISAPGEYVFDFPMHAKPNFMSGDVWPSGEYFVKIYFDRKLINEYSVMRD